MTQEDKELLFRDLCARLSYWVNVSHNGVVYHAIGYAHGKIELCKPFSSITQWVNIDEIKPHLRPMESMTEEEKKQFDNFICLDEDAWIGKSIKGYINQSIIMSNGIDWLNKKMFDYRGLIPKGLAISTEVFNPYKD